MSERKKIQMTIKKAMKEFDVDWDYIAWENNFDLWALNEGLDDETVVDIDVTKLN